MYSPTRHEDMHVWEVAGEWDLLHTYLCCHFVHKQRPEDLLDVYYKMKKYMQGYVGRVYGIEGPQTWPTNDPCDAIMSPNIRKDHGRPKISYKRAANEPPNPYKLIRSGYSVKCANCEGLFHNYKGYHLPLNPD